MSDGLRGPDDPRSGGGLRRANQRSGRAGERRRRPQRERDDRRERCGSVGGCERNGRRAHAVRDRVAVLPGPGRAERPGARRAAHPHAAGSHDTDLAVEGRDRLGAHRASERSVADELRIRGQPQLQPGQLHAIFELGRPDRRQREGRSGKRHRLRGQRQLVHLPRGPGQELRPNRISRYRVRRAARPVRRILHDERDRRRVAGRHRRSRRRHAHRARLRVSRRGADRRGRPAVAGAAPPAHHLHAGGWPARGDRPFVRNAGRVPRDARARAGDLRSGPRLAAGARQADAVLPGLARGQGARPVHDRRQRVSRVHTRGCRRCRRRDQGVPHAAARKGGAEDAGSDGIDPVDRFERGGVSL